MIMNQYRKQVRLCNMLSLSKHPWLKLINICMIRKVSHKQILNDHNCNKQPQQVVIQGGLFLVTCTSVHDRNDLSGDQKLIYFRGQLGGQAKCLLEGLSLEPVNYATCIDLLVKTYGGKDVIKASHVQAFVKLPTPGFNQE